MLGFTCRRSPAALMPAKAACRVRNAQRRTGRDATDSSGPLIENMLRLVVKLALSARNRPRGCGGFQFGKAAIRGRGIARPMNRIAQSGKGGVIGGNGAGQIGFDPIGEFANAGLPPARSRRAACSGSIAPPVLSSITRLSNRRAGGLTRSAARFHCKDVRSVTRSGNRSISHSGWIWLARCTSGRPRSRRCS